MYDKTVVKDHFGQQYTIQRHINPQIKGKLNQKEFHDQHLARDFVRRLEVPHGYWHGLLTEVGGMCGPVMSEADLECAVCERIVTGQLKVFSISQQKATDSAPQKRAIQIKDSVYHFASAEVLLLDRKEVMHFNSLADAKALLLSLSPGEDQLRAIAGDLNIPVAANSGNAEISNAIAQALVKGDAVVMKDLITSATPVAPTEVVAAAATVTQAGLGPEEEKKKEEKKDEKPVCKYKKLTLTCRHGRSVTLDPSKPPKDGEVLKLQVVSCQNEDLKDSDGNPIFEILKVDTEIDAVCGSHQTNFITVSDSEAKLIGSQSNGKLAKIKSPSKAIKIGGGDSVLKYLWLPNVERDGIRKYKISAVKSCDFSQFEGKGKSILVEVFPYLKWSLNFNVNLGKITSTKPKSDTKLAFNGALKLKQNNEKADEFSADYTKKLEKFEDTLQDFKDVLIKHIIERFADGRNTNIDVTLPKIGLTYDAEFKENKNDLLVTRTHKFTFAAEPFVAIKASVDILPIITNMLSGWWSRLFNVFFDWVKQKRGEKQGQLYIESKVEFVVSIEGDIGASFEHKRSADGKTTTTGEPVKSKIKIKAEGVAKLDGHIYVIKVQVMVRAGLESSIDIGLSLGSDVVKKDEHDLKRSDDAPYVSLYFMFNGIILYLEKEVQTRLEKTSSPQANSKDDDYFGSVVNEVLGESGELGAKRKSRSEPRVWLKMSKKHQFKYYLSDYDQAKVQTQQELKAEEERAAEEQKQQDAAYQIHMSKKQDEKLMSDLKNSNTPKKPL